MDYSKLVPSRELCEGMARLGICQDKPELYWSNYYFDEKFSKLRPGDWEIVTEDNVGDMKKAFIAPALARMMEELPELCKVYHKQEKMWVVSPDMCIDPFRDKHLPNSVAKALVAINKGA